MFEINTWIEEIAQKIKAAFNENVLFIGYQGSYRRGEANENSDIDMVVVLEKMNLEQLEKYKKIVKSMNCSEKACGFLGGKEELKNWSKNELFQLYHDTLPIYGSMKDLIPPLTKQDAFDAAKIGAQNLYHMAVHSFLYSNEKKTVLAELYKAVFFVLQALYFFEKGEYVLSKNELLKKLTGVEREILEITINRENIKDFSDEEVNNTFSLLIEFCKEILTKSL